MIAAAIPGDVAASTLAWLAPRAIAGVERVSATEYARTLPQAGEADESARIVRVAVVGDLLEIDGDDDGIARMRRVFAVEADTSEAEARLGAAAARHDVPALTAALRGSPDLRAPGCTDAHEMLYRAIVGQQISVAAATQQLVLLAALGDDVDAGGLTRRFPTDAQVAEGAMRVLRGPRAKSEAVERAATALTDGELDMSADLAELQASLVTLRGIGPWTAGYVALRLGDPDVLLMGDSAVRAGARRLGIADLPALAADCAPFRSHLMLRCWQAAAGPIGQVASTGG